MSFFLKIGSTKHIVDMFQKEYLFFNTFSSFRSHNLDDLSGRFDPREANTKNTQVKYLEITTAEGVSIKLSEMSKNFNCQFNEHPTVIPYNICSLYTLSYGEDLKVQAIDLRIGHFGDKTLLMHDLGTFFKLLDMALEREQFQYSRKPVIYYDYRSFDGDLTFHHKENSFSFQNEYRILIETPGDRTIKLKIPGLRKISAVINTDQINTLELRPLQE